MKRILSPLRNAALALGLGLPAALVAASATAAPVATITTVADTALPGDSLYRLDTALTDAAGQAFTLRDMAGGPVLVTMFYGDCHTACPIVIETLKRTLAALGPSARQLRVLLVSLDPGRDTPAALAMTAGSHQIDPAVFRLAAARDDSQTRSLAAALHIKYRALADGTINHTTRIVLLDADGKPQAASTRLDAEPDQDFVRQIKTLLSTSKTAKFNLDQGNAK